MEPTEQPKAPLSLRLFGTFDAIIRGEPVPSPRSRREIWLLALLALRGGAEVERPWLAGVLWPDSTEELALYNLRRGLSNLRDFLGVESGRIVSPKPRSVALDLDGCFVDVLEFDRALARGDADSLRRAIDLYRGPLLEGCLEDWAVAERDARELAFTVALEQAAGQSASSGDHAEAVRCSKQVLRLDPFRESALRGMMESLRSSGDYAAATQAYRDFRLHLRDEMNASPGPETVELFQEIREAARIKGAAARPAERTAPSPTRRLPAPASSLIGRARELEQVAEALLTSRAVTLTGPGGVGKTRLALAVAERMEDDLPHGARFVDLSAITDPSLVLSTIGQSLEIRTDSARGIDRALMESLVDRHMLLVIDNCEQVAEASARAISTLISGCPHLRILATSRHALDAPGTSQFPVPPLPVPALSGRSDSAVPDRLVENVACCESVQLFLERARRVTPSFQVTVRNAESIAQICARLDGIPLAIELAAPLVRGLTADQIAGRLTRLFREASPTPGDRHRTMRGTMDWSHGLLTEREQLLLRRLGVFSGGFTLEAAEAICSGEGIEANDVLNLLLQLLDKSLILHEELPEEGRYRLLETLRAYALEKLGEGEEAQRLRGRHFDFYYELADNRGAPLTGPKEGAQTRRMDREHDNIRAALASAASGYDHARLAGAMWQFWHYRGHLEEGRRRLEQAIAEYGEEAAPASDLARALLGAGVMAYDQDFFDPMAESRWTEALAMYTAVNDDKGTAETLNCLGILAWRKQDYETGRRRLEQAADLWRQLNDDQRLAMLLGNLGSLELDAGEIDRAAELLEENLKLLRSVGMEQVAGMVLMNLSQVAVYRQQYDRARNLVEQSVEILRRLDHRPSATNATYVLSLVAIQQGDLATARRMLPSAVAQWRALGSLAGRQTLAGCVELLTAEGDFYKAATILGAWEALRDQHDLRITPAMQPAYERSVQAIRAGLTGTEVADAIAAGGCLSFDHALDLALDAMPCGEIGQRGRG